MIEKPIGEDLMELKLGAIQGIPGKESEIKQNREMIWKFGETMSDAFQNNIIIVHR